MAWSNGRKWACSVLLVTIVGVGVFLYIHFTECPKCQQGYICSDCAHGFKKRQFVRARTTDVFRLVNKSLPFNKYAFLTTHNSYAVRDSNLRLTFYNQEGTITAQLHNGVRALMLDTYDFQDDIWLCHTLTGECDMTNAFVKALHVLKEVEAFLSSYPTEIVTLILEDYVKSPNGLTKVFTKAGLEKYWFPVQSMPPPSQDWPLVSDMIANNERLIVFTSKRYKQQQENIAYLESQYGATGMKDGVCTNRAESSLMNDVTKSLVLVNHIWSIPPEPDSCTENSIDLFKMLNTCYEAAGGRWENFVAVDYYKRSIGGEVFKALDMLNGELLCGLDDIHACMTHNKTI